VGVQIVSVNGIVLMSDRKITFSVDRLRVFFSGFHKGSMQEPDNFHFYRFEKNAVKVFSRASVNKVLTKYCKSINRVFGSTCTKICINFIAILSIYLFLPRN